MSLNRLFARRLGRATLALCAAAVLSACGGGDRAEPFKPSRIVAFGDELSVLDDSASAGQALKYSVNGFTANTTQLDCTVNPIWIQTLASRYGMGFSQCPGTAASQSAYTYAQVGAKIGDLTQQISHLGSPSGNDLVTVMVGSHDVLEVYADWKAGLSRDAALDRIRDRAETLAGLVSGLFKQGPAVLIATVPYLGASPFAVQEEAAGPGLGRQQMLIDLVDAFNVALISSGRGKDNADARNGLAYYSTSGSDYGLLQVGTSWIRNIAKSESSSVRAYNATAMCDSTKGGVLPNCTPSTLVDGADINNWVWADATRPGYAFHVQVSSRAITLAERLPF